MPNRPNIPCKYPGCPNLVPAGEKYCSQHMPMHSRPAAQRGYGSKWQKARRQFLEAHPLCVECLKSGRYVKATVVDHIVPHRGDQKLFWDRSNWQALCKPCHDHKTMTEDRWEEYKY